MGEAGLADYVELRRGEPMVLKFFRGMTSGR
jgi:hypothetical protein